MTGLTTWAIVGDIDAPEAREIDVADIGRADVLAVHPDRASAERGIDRMGMMRAAIAAKLQASREAQAQFEQLLEVARRNEKIARDALEVERKIQDKLIASVRQVAGPDRPGAPVRPG